MKLLLRWSNMKIFQMNFQKNSIFLPKLLVSPEQNRYYGESQNKTWDQSPPTYPFLKTQKRKCWLVVSWKFYNQRWPVVVKPTTTGLNYIVLIFSFVVIITTKTIVRYFISILITQGCVCLTPVSTRPETADDFLLFL